MLYDSYVNRLGSQYVYGASSVRHPPPNASSYYGTSKIEAWICTVSKSRLEPIRVLKHARTERLNYMQLFHVTESLQHHLTPKNLLNRKTSTFLVLSEYSGIKLFKQVQKSIAYHNFLDKYVPYLRSLLSFFKRNLPILR